MEVQNVKEQLGIDLGVNNLDPRTSTLRVLRTFVPKKDGLIFNAPTGGPKRVIAQ